MKKGFCSLNNITINIVFEFMILNIFYELGNEILTGSWRIDNQLEVWDFISGKRITGDTCI